MFELAYTCTPRPPPSTGDFPTFVRGIFDDYCYLLGYLQHGRFWRRFRCFFSKFFPFINDLSHFCSVSLFRPREGVTPLPSLCEPPFLQQDTKPPPFFFDVLFIPPQVPCSTFLLTGIFTFSISVYHLLL